MSRIGKILLLILTFFVNLNFDGKLSAQYIRLKTDSQVVKHDSVQPGILESFAKQDFITLLSVGKVSKSQPFSISVFLGSLPILLRILIICMAYFVTSIFILIILVLIRRISHYYREKRFKRVRETYSRILTDYLFAESKIELSLRLKYEMNKEFYREVLLDLLLDLHSNITGAVGDQLVELYNQLGLKQHSIQKIYHRNWHVKAKGFRELAQMGVTDVNDVLFSYINHPNLILRIEAEMALVKLHVDYPLHFLKNLKYYFTDWSQMNVYDTLNYHNLEVPRFREMLFHENESVVLFCLRMINYYRQTDAVDDLFKLLKHKSEIIREHTIIALKRMEVIEVDAVLRTVFDNETKQNKILIVASIDQLSDSDNLNFLIRVLMNEPDFHIRLEAAKSLHKTGELGIKFLNSLLPEATGELLSIINHAKDHRLNV